MLYLTRRRQFLGELLRTVEAQAAKVVLDLSDIVGGRMTKATEAAKVLTGWMMDGLMMDGLMWKDTDLTRVFLIAGLMFRGTYVLRGANGGSKGSA